MYIHLHSIVMYIIISHIPNLYFSFITLQPHKECVEHIQYQPAFTITGTWKGLNRNKLEDKLAWQSTMW